MQGWDIMGTLWLRAVCGKEGFVLETSFQTLLFSARWTTTGSLQRKVGKTYDKDKCWMQSIDLWNKYNCMCFGRIWSDIFTDYSSNIFTDNPLLILVIFSTVVCKFFQIFHRVICCCFVANLNVSPFKASILFLLLLTTTSLFICFWIRSAFHFLLCPILVGFCNYEPSMMTLYSLISNHKQMFKSLWTRGKRLLF